jgi:hypothetical protein
MQLNISTPKAITAAVAKFNKLAANADKKTADAFREATLAAHQVRIVSDWYDHPDTKAAAKEAGGKLPPKKEYLPAVLGKAYSTLRRYVQVAEAIDGGASIADYLTAEAEAAADKGGDLQCSQLRFLRWVAEGVLETPPAEVEESEGAEGEETAEVEETAPADGIIRVRAEGCAVDFDPETGEFTLNGPRAAEALDALLGAWAAAQA